MSQYVVRAVKGPDEELPELHIKEYDRRKAPRTMPRPPFLCGMFGSRGAGKTSLLVKLIRWYDSVRAFDRVVVFSPTHQKDPKWEALQNSGMYAKPTKRSYDDNDCSPKCSADPRHQRD
jgi:signal recognition particle GTPase